MGIYDRPKNSKRYIDDIMYNSASIKGRIALAKKALPRKDFETIFTHRRSDKYGPSVKGFKQLPYRVKKQLYGFSLD